MISAVAAAQDVGGFQIARSQKTGSGDENAMSFGQIMSDSLSGMEYHSSSSVSQSENTSAKSEKTDAGSSDSIKKAEDTVTEASETDKISDENTAENHETEIESEEPAVKEKIADALSTAAETLKNKIKDVFGVSEEDIENALQAMGMTVFDLFDNSKMTEFVAVLNGNEDALSILTDSRLSDGLDLLNETAGMLIAEIAEENDVPVETVEMLTGQPEDTGMEEKTAPEPDFDMPEVIIMDNRTGVKEGSSMQEQESSPSESHTDDGAHSETKPENVILNNLSQAVNTSIQAETAVDAVQYTEESVINQIVEAARVTLNDQVSSMELTLNPESLGKVNLTVSVREGVVTAQITAENQAAKEAIENQVVFLKEQLNNQGLKVEAVEVTIASHSFEAGHEQSENSAENTENSDKGRKNGIGKIDLSSLDDINMDELSEEEKIVADMMAMEGNVVNYKV